MRVEKNTPSTIIRKSCKIIDSLSRNETRNSPNPTCGRKCIVKIKRLSTTRTVKKGTFPQNFTKATNDTFYFLDGSIRKNIPDSVDVFNKSENNIESEIIHQGNKKRPRLERIKNFNAEDASLKNMVFASQKIQSSSREKLIYAKKPIEASLTNGEEQNSPILRQRGCNASTPRKRKRNRPSAVFEFPSQTVVDSKNFDPAEDVIKKLIYDGKVRVATNCKGKGRPVIKTKAAKKTSNKRKIGKSKQMRVQQSTAPPKVVESNNKIPIDLPNVDYNDNKNNKSTNLEKTNHTSRSPTKKSAEDCDIQSATKHPFNSHNKRAQQLLYMVHKIVSTPKNNIISTHENSLYSSLSPITKPPLTFDKINHTSSLTNSPWRFNGNNTISNQTNESNNRTVANQSNSSYNPNAENLPPNETNTKESNVLDKTQKKQITDRSSRVPLKAVNILEVKVLPPWRKAPPFESNVENGINPVDAVPQEFLEKQSFQNLQTHNNQEIKTSDQLNLFGFEDFFIEQPDLDSKHNKIEHKTYANLQKKNTTLHEKLKNLRKWYPTDYDKVASTKNAQMSEKTKDVARSKSFYQKDIKEMLCSTRIQSATNNEALDVQGHSNQTIHCPDSNSLFTDFESETLSREQKEPFRTYVKPSKRKHSRRERNYFESCNGEEFENESDPAKVSNVEGAQKDKHHHGKGHRENLELEEFAKSFNNLCEEVEKFELIVEQGDT